MHGNTLVLATFVFAMTIFTAGLFFFTGRNVAFGELLRRLGPAAIATLLAYSAEVMAKLLGIVLPTGAVHYGTLAIAVLTCGGALISAMKPLAREAAE